MISRILKLFLVPFIGIFAFILFFMFLLTPAQRDVIFSEVLSKLPIAKNFVTRPYDTHVYGLNFADASDLKTATWAVDQLVLLEKKNKDKKIGKYYAIYPYVIEAGFDLSKVKVEEDTSGKKLRLIMPPVEVVNVDVDQKKGLTVIRDSLEENYEEALQPLKIGYHRFVHDLALQSNLLKNARTSVTDYFQTFWKHIYEKVEVVHTPWVNPISTVDRQHIPLQIRYNAQTGMNLEFVQEKPFARFDTLIGTNAGFLYMGLSKPFSGSYRDLTEKVKMNIGENLTFINSFHPCNPREGSWLGGIMSGKQSLYCFKLHKGEYIFSSCRFEGC